MAERKKTTKQLSDERAKILSSLPFFKANNIEVVNTQWMQTGETFCELFSRKTRKRIKIKTNVLFNKREFLDDMNGYIQTQKYVTDLFYYISFYEK